MLLRFEQPEPADADGACRADRWREIDLDLAWEFAPEGEFALRRAGARLLRRQGRRRRSRPRRCCGLFAAPHYFRRLGKGQFRKAPEEIVKAALLGIERKKPGRGAGRRLGRASCSAARCPAPMREQLYRILFKPDKNAPEYKAVVEAARRARRAPLDLLKAAGAIDSPYQFHWRRFLFEKFPKRHRLRRRAAVPPMQRGARRWPTAQAFSIDDSATTEIDDALSVQGLGSGTGHGRHPHRRAGAGVRAGIGGRRRSRASASRRSTCRATS